MTDLATLGIVIDSSQAPKAASDLDKLTAAGARAETEMGSLTRETKTASVAAAEYAAKAQATAKSAVGLGNASGLARVQMLELSHVATSLSGSLIAGQNPLRAFAVELPRIAQAASLGQGGLLGMARAVGALIAPFIAVLVPLGLVVAAFVGMKQAAEAADPAAKHLISTLGLTDKEIKKLKDTTVSWGDLASATFEVLAEKAGLSASGIKKWFGDAFHSITDFGKFSVAIIIAAFASLGTAAKDVFFKLPAIVGEASVGAANAAIAGVEALANKGVQALNAMSSAINNSLIGKGLREAFGVELPTLAAVSLGRVQNAFAGTTKSIAADVSGTFHSTFNAVQSTFDEISARASSKRDARVIAEANELIADRTNKAAAAHRDRAKAARDEADALDKLKERLASLMSHLADVDLKQGDISGLLNIPDLKDLLPTIDQDQLLAGPNALLEKLQEIGDQAQVTGQIMTDAFGNAGDVFGGILANMADYQTAQQTLALDVLKGSKTQEQADKALSTLRARNTAMALSGLKSLFKEHSAGYKVMSAIEKAYAAFQAVETALSIAREFTKTATTVTQAGIRTTANTAEGGSKIFAELGPWAFPVVAAMVAVLAALGAKGGGGGGGAAPPTSADDVQAGNGAGSVLGDSKAKSESIANSLELVAANTNKDLEYSNAMLRSLRSIDISISKLAGTVARQISVSGSLFDTSGLGLGTTGKSGFLGIGASSTTKSLFDLGLTLNSASVADIIANGISGQTYQIVEKVKKKSGFFGIGGGTKTTYTTTNGQIDPEITDAIQGVILSLRDGLVSAAKVIGLDGAQAILDGFQVNIGKVSFKDMTGQEIEDQLNAIFSKVGDQMAAALFPTLATMQKVGEGLFETFIRVAKEYEAVDTALKSIGKEFGAVGVGSIQARDALVQLFGGLDDFISATDEFRSDFLSEAEQIAPVQAAVTAELQRLGMAGITTRDQFKQAVLGLDLTTDAGRQMYASLLAVAPAFDKVLDYFDQLNKKAIQGFQQTIDQFSKFVDSLTKYRATLFATDAAQGNAYASLKAKFIATAGLAATGDATALGGLEQSGKDFLTAAKNNASSLQDYYRDVAVVAQGVDKGIFAAESTADYAQLQLDALQNATSILGTIAQNTQATAAALGAGPVPAPAAAPSAMTANGAPAASSEDIAQLKADTNAALQAIATSNASIERLLKRWDDGDALVVTTRDGEALDVNLESWG